MKKRLKINGAIMVSAVLLIVFFPKIFFRKPYLDYLDDISEIFGVSFILLGQLFRVSARGYKSEHSRQGNALIQDGPYALVRNPMYLGILLIGIGIVAVLFKWWVAAIFLLVFITRYILLIFKEEKKLKDLFPGDYLDYQRRVPRILPPISIVLKADISEYLPLKLSWIKKEIGSILAVLFITLLVESWEDIKTEGLRVYLWEIIPMIITFLLFIFLIFYLNKRISGLAKHGPNKSTNNL
jgi:protein-S-isoprenylcysteine O-methyltransferase Ste14